MNHGTTRFRKVAVGALASLTALVGLGSLTAPVGGLANFTSTRLAGIDRYATAAEIAKATFPSGAADAVLATGERFPDALAGNFLAGAKSAPILLTQINSLPAVTKTALSDLKVKNVHILGGTQAVSAAVASEIGALTSTAAGGGNIVVTRFGGADRYETARLVATAAGTTVGSLTGKKTAILATGDKFADALSGGPVAYAGDFPVLLTPGAPSSTLNSNAQSALTSLGIQHVLILGGNLAITDAVETAVKNTGGTNAITTQRLQGNERTATAAAIADFALASMGFRNTHVNLARGDDPNGFADALSGGPHGGNETSPIVLASTPTTLGAATVSWLQAHASTLTDGHIFGGTVAISDAVKTEFENAAKTGGGVSGNTSRPELVSATIIETTAAGSLVRFIFDEPVTGKTPVGGSFHLYNNANPPVVESGTTANPDATNTSAVVVLFPGVNTSSEASALTLATVDEAAVQGIGPATAQGPDENPIGDAAVGSTSTTPLAAGITDGPDLVSVGTFTPDPGNAANTRATFTFDEAADNLTNDYYLVQLEGTQEIQCDFVSGEDTTAHVVTCPNPLAGAPSATNVARGYVLEGTVAETDGVTNPNVTQAADVGASGNTATPDLVSFTLLPDAAVSAVAPAPGSSLGAVGTNIDRARLVFDEPINLVNENIVFYQSDGTTIDCSAVTCEAYESTVAETDVFVDVQDNTLGSVVGVWVEEGTVQEASGATRDNLVDEVGVSNPPTTSVTSGRTAGPDLTGVTVTALKDPGGTITGYTATYTFDEDIDTAAPPAGSFKLYDAAGLSLTCTAVQTFVGQEDKDNTVQCNSFDVTTVGGTATLAQLGGAVLGTVDDGAVQEEGVGTNANPEGASGVTRSGF